MLDTIKTKPKIVIHVCCAICGAYLSELLKKDFEITIFFYNPNIHPKEEYDKRKESVQKLAEIYGLEFIEGDYDVDNWLNTVKGLEKEPEGGQRCPVCFKMRLLQTASLAKQKNAQYFTTTLATSPYKNESIVSEIGKNIAKETGIKFFELANLKEGKQEIWKKTRELARKYNFYHQKYCGCMFSQKNNPPNS